VICPACEAWIEAEPDREARVLRCPECGGREPHAFPPLFILTGPSGSGKSAVLSALRPLLPEWEVFETDILWDSGGDWSFVRGNWLRIALGVWHNGRPTLLCGIHVPETIEACPDRRYFGRVHYLALDCRTEIREQRLRARPAWRGITEAFIEEQHRFAEWLDAHAQTAFDPPLARLDTSALSVEVTASRIAVWAGSRLAEDVRNVPASSP
jgi:energy-coupling factor transporter ATP-binding protein EcfA2